MQFREIWIPKWATAFTTEVERRTGTDQFTYYLAVTRVTGDTAAWENDPRIHENLRGNPFRFLTLATMWSTVVNTMSLTPALRPVSVSCGIGSPAGQLGCSTIESG